MKPTQFEYHRPTTIAETTELLDELSGAELMAGNQSLGIIMANRLATPDHLIDINYVDDLTGIEVTDTEVKIGALTRHREIERSDNLLKYLPLFSEAANKIAGPVVRNRGTIGGSIGEADPAGNYPCVLMALEGVINISSSDGSRSVPAEDYFIAYMFTDLAEDELIESVTISMESFPPERTGMAFLEYKEAAQTWPTISAATAVRVENTSSSPAIEEARIALANVSDIPLRVKIAEEVIEGGQLTETALETAADKVKEKAEPEGEMHASIEHKEALAGEYTRRSLKTAYDRAKQT